MANTTSESIPSDLAIKLCEQIRSEKKVRLFSQCWGCLKFSKGDLDKMCFANDPNNRGCGLVNKRFERDR